MSETTNDPITLRAAAAEDVVRVAELLVALYEAELPGALVGTIAARRQLLEYTLEARGHAGLRGRHLVCAAGGDVVGLLGIRFDGDPPVAEAPPGTLRRGLRLFGIVDTTRMLRTFAQAVFQKPPRVAPDEVLFHGVVVDPTQQRRGIARSAVLEAERIAFDRGCRVASIQVVTSNRSGRRFWESMGYRIVPSSTRPWLVPSFPIDTLRKSLARGESAL